jgi:hypothetical protein
MTHSLRIRFKVFPLTLLRFKFDLGLKSSAGKLILDRTNVLSNQMLLIVS